MTAAEASGPALRSAILAMCEAMDPDRQGDWWPDPSAWDGRPLAEIAADLLMEATTGPYACRGDPEERAAALDALCDAMGPAAFSYINAVCDPRGGIWHPSSEAEAEIEASDDPGATACRIAHAEPMRGRWVQ